MKDNKMGNTWYAFIKSILYIFTESLHSKLPIHTWNGGAWRGGGGLGGLPNNFA